MATRIDHFMYAVPSLDEGLEWAADIFDNPPAYGGEHIGLGTRNALLSLGSCYLEIIAPDPNQSLAGTLGEQFLGLTEGGLTTWAVEGNLLQLQRLLKEGGVSTTKPRSTQRKAQDGELLVWELMFARRSPFGARMPFFIDWLDCVNPKDSNPDGGQYKEFCITSDTAEPLAAALQPLGLTIPIAAGDNRLALTIETNRGLVELTSTAATSALAVG